MKTRILLFNSSPEDLLDIEEALANSAYEIVQRCSRISDISRAIIKSDVDMLMAVTDKKFDQLFACVKQINQLKPVPVVVFTYEDDRDVIHAAIKAGVSAFIVDGLQAKRIVPIIETARIRFKEQQAIKVELDRTKETLSERKLIERAKGIVMQRSNIDEEEAYKSMRKMAMDKNIKLSELARSVISAAELIM